MSVMQSAPGPETIIDGRRVLYFAGCGYLGLQGDPRVIEAACEATRKYGLHTATSRGGFGDSPPVLEVEKRAAEIFGTEDAFYFPTGYAGPTILLDAFNTQFDAIIVDEASHFASRDAAAMTGEGNRQAARIARVRHGDCEHLRRLLAAADGERVAVLCDGVSPVLGDIAPLPEIHAAVKEHGLAVLIVDDAHGLGTLGSRGRGIVEFYEERTGLTCRVNEHGEVGGAMPVYRCGTLSKAVGGYGGVIAGSRDFVADAKRSSWFNGASALPVGVAAATAKALEIVIAEPGLRQSLHANVKRMKDGLRSLGLTVNDNPVPIICLQLGDAANMQRIQQALMRRDIAIAYIRSYSGVGPQGALRIAVFANHTAAMIDRLIEELRGWV